MNKYENLGVVGEGSYGVVMKCRHKETGLVVAIKKFLETDEDHLIRKIAMREINMLKKLRHENLVNLIEVFRRKKHLYLVLEYVDHTVLDELEQQSGGLGEEICREYVWQILRGVEFCHLNNIVHRDVKPENVLVSNLGVVKLCDFGFARLLTSKGESCTDYVATRWYRAPELLVGDTRYGKEVDLWAVGCLFSEMATGDPLFPGESDIDQLFCIMRHMGNLAMKHQDMMDRNPMFQGMRSPPVTIMPLRDKFITWSTLAIDFLEECLKIDPDQRMTTSQILQHQYFLWDRFPERFIIELERKFLLEFSGSLAFNKPTYIPKNNSVCRKVLGQTPAENESRKLTSMDEVLNKMVMVPLIRDSQTTEPTTGNTITINTTTNNKSVQNQKPPTKVKPLSPPRSRMNCCAEPESPDFHPLSAFPIPPIINNNRTDFSAKNFNSESRRIFSPHQSYHTKNNDSDSLLVQSLNWMPADRSRKPTPVQASRRNLEVSSMGGVCSSQSPIGDFIALQVERSFLHNRRQAMEVKSQDSKMRNKAESNLTAYLNAQHENCNTLPNIIQSSGPLSPIRSKVFSSHKKIPFRGVIPSIANMDLLTEKSSESHPRSTTPSPSTGSRQVHNWKTVWKT